MDLAERLCYERDELLAISRALSSERDSRKLLDLILAKSREITGADAGSVYVLEAPDEDDDGVPDRGKDKVLHFMLSQNDSIAIDFKEFSLHVDEQSIVGKAVLQKKPINIPDMGRLADPSHNPWGFRHNRSFDDKTGYRAGSMLTVPMLSARDEVIGVVQLINKKRLPTHKLVTPDDFEHQVIPFDDRSEELALALAGQAGICLENANLYREITSLFEGFVEASVTAIESRDPTTSGHSRRVATLTVALAQAVDAAGDGPFRDVHFSREELRQIEYAGVLHDFGKVGVRESVLVKAKKLYDWQRDAIDMRFRYLRKMFEAQALSQQVALLQAGNGPSGRNGQSTASELNAVERALAERLAMIDELWKLVLAANEPSLLGEQMAERLHQLGLSEYQDADGSHRTFLKTDELMALEVLRGSLTAAERLEIQSHVTHTMAFLDTIPWGRALKNVPRIAGSHHELLDGKGYPFGLRADQIPLETRMLTISDIFDALTAADRPYKSAVPVPKALDIIGSEVKSGRCDPQLFQMFVEAQVHKRVIG